ncbi:MAG: YceI family protein [Chloroflexi bacterium]|nr:YceI family protein [Chloroflexota bacterium]
MPVIDIHAHLTPEQARHLTIHGVTREVTVPIEGQLVGRSMVLVGSIDIVFADYAIDTPSAAVVLSVEHNGEMEFQLFLTKSTGS